MIPKVGYNNASMHLLLDDTPVLLSVVGTRLLPQVVESIEVSSIVTARRSNAFKGILLVLQRWDGNVVAVTSGWPASLSNENLLLVATGRGDSLDLLQQPLTSILGLDVTVKESVGIDSKVVRSVTQVRVVDNSNEGVNRDNWTVVASSLQGRLGGVNVLLNLGWVGLTRVNQLVTDRDSVNNVPATVVLDILSQVLDLLLNVGGVKDTKEDLLARRQSSQGVLNLVTVGTVKSDQGVVGQLGNVALHLGSGLTRVVLVVRGVGNTLGTSREVVGARGGGGRARASAGSRSRGVSGLSSRRSWHRWLLLNRLRGDRLRRGRLGGLGVNWSGGLLRGATSGSHNDGVVNSDSPLFVLVVLVLLNWLSKSSRGHKGGRNE